MNKQFKITTVILFLLWAGNFIVSGQKTASTTVQGKKPNILFLIADDLRAGMIHQSGNTKIITPALDALYKRGVIFANSYTGGSLANAAVCAPSRAMLLTGRGVLQIVPNGLSIPKDQKTMPEVFKENGYYTYGIGKWHNGKSSFARSFSGGSKILFQGMTGSQYVLPLYAFDSSGVYPKSDMKIEKGVHSSVVYANAAINFLETFHQPKPFFLYVAFQAPHDPKQAPEKYFNMYDTADITLPPNFLNRYPFDFGETDVRDEKLAPYPRQPEEIKMQIRAYYAVITYLDHEIGKIIDALKETGRFNNTIIVFTADHGLSLGEHAQMGKQSLYECNIKIPLIVAGPGISHRQINDFILHQDVFPTLTDLANIPEPETVTGYSFKKVIEGEEKGKRDAIFFIYKNFQRAYRKGKWKLITYNVKGQVHNELFNLKKDLWETKNLFTIKKRKAISMKKELQTTLAKAGDLVQFNKPHWGVKEIPSWAEKVRKMKQKKNRKSN